MRRLLKRRYLICYIRDLVYIVVLVKQVRNAIYAITIAEY